jgi:hypothetical protein
MGIVYLAAPYSHPILAERIRRFEAINRHAAKMMRDGIIVFSPISHTHPIAMAGELPTGWEFWGKQDREFLSHCKRFVVLKLPGWDKSKGVAAEMKIADELGLAVELLEPTE